MPIYEYTCASCGTRFELLVRQGTKVACPSCGKEKVERRLSVFAPVAKTAKAQPTCCHDAGGCHSGHDGPVCHDAGRCGSGLCGAR